MSDFPTDEELRTLAKKIRSTANSQEYKNEVTNIPREFRDGALDARDQYANSKKYDWVIELFEGFLKPYPGDAFDTKLEAIKTLAASLDTSVKGENTTGEVESTMTEAAGNISNNWQGELADSLTKNYLNPMSTHIPKNQGRCLLVLHDGLQGMRDIHRETRRNLKTLGDQCITALDNADGTPVNDVQAMLTILSNILAVGLAVLAGTSAPVIGGVTSAIVAGGFAAADKKLDEKKEEIPLAAMHPEDVMDNFKEAVGKKREELTTKEDELSKALRKGAVDILNIATNGQFLVNEMMDIDLPLIAMPKGSVLTPQIPDLAMSAIGDPPSVKDGLFQIDDK